MALFLAKHKTTDFLVLDLGSGGRPYRYLFPNALGADLNYASGVDVQVDAHHLPFKDNSFNMIVSTEMLEHLERPWEAVAQMRRVIKPGGKLILTTRFIFPIHGAPYDYFRYTKFGLRSLFKDWKIISLQEEAVALETMAILFQRLGFQTVTRPPFLRFLFFLIARFLSPLSPIVVATAGEIERKNFDNSILPSGYYLVCQKVP